MAQGRGTTAAPPLSFITPHDCTLVHCTRNAFRIQVDVGLAADVGSLQRLPRCIGNDSLVRELAYTARKLPASEALRCGLVSSVHTDKAGVRKAALDMAAVIASKSPVAV